MSRKKKSGGGSVVRYPPLPRGMNLYWAYGSNLCVDAMKRRCPRATPYRPLLVNNGLLVFRGVADVEASASQSHVVAGGLWWITRECEAALDRYEGCSASGRGLYSKRYLTLQVGDEVRKCLFYKMNSEGVMPPWEEYLEVIAQGYRDFDLPLDMLSQAVERSWGEKNKTPDLTRRWVARGRPSLAKALGS